MFKIILLICLCLSGCAKPDNSIQTSQLNNKGHNKTLNEHLINNDYQEIEPHIYELKLESNRYYFNLPAQSFIQIKSSESNEIVLYYYRTDEGTTFSKEGVRCNYNFSTLEKTRFCELEDIESMKQIRRNFGIELSRMNITDLVFFDYFDEQSEEWKQKSNQEFPPQNQNNESSLLKKQDLNTTALIRNLNEEDYRIKDKTISIGFDLKGDPTAFNKASEIHEFNFDNQSFSIVGKDVHYYYAEDIATAFDRIHRCAYKYALSKSDCDLSMDVQFLKLKQSFFKDLMLLEIKLEDLS